MTCSTLPTARARACSVSVLLWCCAVPSLFGCGGANEVSIVVVEPRVVEAGDAFLVRGSGFEWDYNAFTDAVVGNFTIELNDVAAENVEWIDATQLEARVPIDMPAGVVDVTVTGPRGSATEDDALIIRD
jgi:hypothetical protein